jgi:hypothetical protein
MKAIYALYPSTEGAQRAVDSLREAGFAHRDITILSSEPLEHYEFARRDMSTWMSGIAAMGGFIGMATGYLLTSLSQKAWPINTGGMPIVSDYPNLIVIFELTMLGAVFATVITLLVTAGIPSRSADIYDPEISEGKILIGVTNPRDPAAVQRALRSAGVEELKTI